MAKSSQLQMTLGLGSLAFLGILILLPLAYFIITKIESTSDVVTGEALTYVWGPWDIRFDVPPGMKVGKVNDRMLVINETGVLPDGDLPQMKVYLRDNTSVAAIVSTYKKEDYFSSTTATMNGNAVTTVDYDDGFAGPDTVYLVQIGDDVMEYRLAHAVGTTGSEYDELAAGIVLSSLEF